MELEQLLESVPDYARDIKLNMGNVLRQPELTEQQAWGTAVACAMAARNPVVAEAVAADGAKHLSEQALYAAKAAAAVMGMNNVFYRFRHLATNEKYAAMPARLRMQAIRTHGSDPVDFELWCLAVSAMNGCAACVNSHEMVVREKGVSEEAVLAAVRIASVVNALAAAMTTAATAGTAPA